MGVLRAPFFFAQEVPTVATKPNTRPAVLVVLTVLLLIGAAVFPSIPQARAASGAPYSGLAALGMPASPQIFYPQVGYDVAVSEQGESGSNASISGKLISPNSIADHGPDCSAPAGNALPDATDSHATITTYDSVYVCHDHMMTSLNSPGFGEATIMPDAMPDWSDGQTVTISWRVSTITSSDRDWWDMWLTPFAGQLLAPVADLAAQFNGRPKTAVHLQLCGQGTASTGGHFVCGEILNNGRVTTLRASGVPQESKVTPSRSVRTLYQVDLSATHIKVSLPESGLVFINQDIAALPFSQGVLQLDQESYDPLKTDACGPYGAQRVLGGKCEPNTWHWSDISISNALHFDISHPAQRYMKGSHASNTFSAPAQAGSYLRFGSYGTKQQVSFDGGKTWITAVNQPSEFAQNAYTLHQFLVPLTEGATGFQVRGANDGYGRGWYAYDFAVLGPVGAAESQPPTPTPTPTEPRSHRAQHRRRSASTMHRACW